MEITIPFALILNPTSTVGTVNTITFEHLFDQIRTMTKSANHGVRLQLCEQFMTRHDYNARINDFFDQYTVDDINRMALTDHDIYLRDMGLLIQESSKQSFSVIKNCFPSLIKNVNAPPKVIFMAISAEEERLNDYFVALFDMLDAERLESNQSDQLTLYPYVLTLTDEIHMTLEAAFNCNYSRKCQIGLLV